MKDPDELTTIGWFGVITILAAFLFLILMSGCAHTPPPQCRKAPTSYDACAATCSTRDAFIVENSTDIQCICRKPPDGT